jgi:hypothetical protein
VGFFFLPSPPPPCGTAAQVGPRPSLLVRFLDHMFKTNIHTPDRTPLCESSACHRGCYLHNTQQAWDECACPQQGSKLWSSPSSGCKPVPCLLEFYFCPCESSRTQWPYPPPTPPLPSPLHKVEDKHYEICVTDNWYKWGENIDHIKIFTFISNACDMVHALLNIKEH